MNARIYPVCPKHTGYTGSEKPGPSCNCQRCYEIRQEWRRRSALKVGDLCYIDGVGFPYNRTDFSHDTWDGAPVMIDELDAGASSDSVRVRPLYPMRGNGADVPFAILGYGVVFKVTRPWLKAKFKERIRRIEIEKQIRELERQKETLEDQLDAIDRA